VAVVAEEEKSGSPLLIGMALVGAPVFLVVLLLIVLGGGAVRAVRVAPRRGWGR